MFNRKIYGELANKKRFYLYVAQYAVVDVVFFGNELIIAAYHECVQIKKKNR